MSYFLVFIHYTHRVDVRCLTSQCSFTSHTRWMCDVLLPCVNSLQTQGGCEMSYFRVIIHYTHRVNVLCITSLQSFTTHTGWMCDAILLVLRPSQYKQTDIRLTGWMGDVLLPCNHSIHTQGGYVMSYFPVIIHYTHRVDVRCLTSQCSFPTHTGWM